MATQVDQGERDVQEQLARIRQMGVNTDKAIIEMQKNRIDIGKVLIDIDNARVEIGKALVDTKVVTFSAIFQGLIAVAALLGAGAAIAKLFFP